MNRKNLHKHSLPVVMILAIATVLSCSIMQHATNGGVTSMAKALVTPYVKVEPTKNGLARISLSHQSATVSSDSPDPATASKEFDAIGSDTGKLTRLNFVVEALHPTKFTATQ